MTKIHPIIGLKTLCPNQ